MQQNVQASYHSYQSNLSVPIHLIHTHEKNTKPKNQNLSTQFGGLDSIVSIVTRPRAGRQGVQIPAGQEIQNVQIGSRAYPASCSMCTGALLGGKEAGA
jgi:hypothetical protein